MATLRAAGAWVSLAHPRHYDFTRSKRRRLVSEFIAAGGQALEVVNGLQPAEQVGSLAILAREFGLLASIGSDFHAPAQWAELGLIALCRKICRHCGCVSATVRPGPCIEQGRGHEPVFPDPPGESPAAADQADRGNPARRRVIVYPTDSSYALGCQLGDKGALERIRRLRRLDDKHNFTLVCCDLSQLGIFAKVDTGAFRLLKTHTPGPYTFILDATREVPRMLLHPKRRTIGLRVPAHPIAQALLRELDAPLMSVSLIMPGEDLPLSDPYDMRGLLEHHVDLIIDGGFGGLERRRWST